MPTLWFVLVAIAVLGACGGTEPTATGRDASAEDGGQDAGKCDSPVLAQPCDAGEGECMRSGIYECEGGRVVCSARPATAKNELCDEKDNDCDGLYDEDWPDLGAPCRKGRSECESSGIIRCRRQGDGTECSAADIEPVAELCDGLDNNCDGDTDEPWREKLGFECVSGLGECEQKGRWECGLDGSDAVCSGEPLLEQPELCDSKDNDCDGDTDEFWDELGTQCEAGTGDCLRRGFFVCSADGATVRCSASAGQPTAEVCDGRDNNCDGQPDEPWVSQLAEPCSAGIGECRTEGRLRCSASGSGTECDASTAQPQEEACDFKDNDCDGYTDETAPACVTTLAGTGQASARDGQALTEASFAGPAGVSVGFDGTIYVADAMGNRIRIYDEVAKVVETLAGSGIYGFSSGIAADAEFRWPAGVALSAAGDLLYIADRFNHAVRAYSVSDGSVTTIAGSGEAGYQDGAGSDAAFKEPFGLAVSAQEEIFVADKDNHCVRKITRDEGGTYSVSTVAGECGTSGFLNGAASTAKFNSPSSLALDANRNLFVADAANNRIRLISLDIDPSNAWFVRSIAGTGVAGNLDGSGATATFNAPAGIAATGANYLYVSDSASSRLRQVYYSDNFSSVTVTTILSTGLSTPQSLAIGRGGYLFVSEFFGYRLRKVNPASGSMSTIAGTGAAASLDGPRLQAQFINPAALAVASDGSVYVADCGGNRVRKVATDDVSTFIGSGVYGYLDGYPDRVNMRCPSGLALDGSGSLYVSEKGNHCIRKFVAETGTVVTLAGTCGSAGFNNGASGSAKFKGPTGIALGRSGNLFVADTQNNRIRKILLDTGEVSTLAGHGDTGYRDGDAGAARFSAPTDLALQEDDLGAPERLFIADSNNHAIRVYTFSDNKVSTFCGIDQGFADGQSSVARFNYPVGLGSFRDAEGNFLLAVADRGNHRVRLVDETGFVVTLCGTDQPGFADGAISEAVFYSPAGISIGAGLEVYVADTDGNRIRVIVR